MMIGDDLVIILISLQSILIVCTILHLLEVLDHASNYLTLGPFRSDKITDGNKSLNDSFLGEMQLLMPFPESDSSHIILMSHHQLGLSLSTLAKL